MSNQNSQDQLMNLAMRELNKVLSDLKEGKTPEMSNAMQKLSQELELTYGKHKNMNEEQIKEWANKIVSEVEKLGQSK